MYASKLLSYRKCFSLQVVKALHYLQAELKVIHRDVKPSNILINRNGQVKMCDFGISGNLVDSVAKTIDAELKSGAVSGVHDGSTIGLMRRALM